MKSTFQVILLYFASTKVKFNITQNPLTISTKTLQLITYIAPIELQAVKRIYKNNEDPTKGKIEAKRI